MRAVEWSWFWGGEREFAMEGGEELQRNGVGQSSTESHSLTLSVLFSLQECASLLSRVESGKRG